MLAYGSPEIRASFSIGNFVSNIPMKEVKTGHYIGYYLPIEEDKFDSATLSVVFEGKKGRKTSLEVKPRNLTLN